VNLIHLLARQGARPGLCAGAGAAVPGLQRGESGQPVHGLDHRPSHPGELCVSGARRSDATRADLAGGVRTSPVRRRTHLLSLHRLHGRRAPVRVGGSGPGPGARSGCGVNAALRTSTPTCPERRLAVGLRPEPTRRPKPVTQRRSAPEDRAPPWSATFRSLHRRQPPAPRNLSTRSPRPARSGVNAALRAPRAGRAGLSPGRRFPLRRAHQPAR
jgi:hypothetical protein